MAPRLNKRQQRELDELNALGAADGVEPVDSESEDDVPAQTQVQSAFAALMSAANGGNGGEEEDGEEEEEETPAARRAKKPKKKKKKSGAATTPTDAAPVDAAAASASKPTPAPPPAPGTPGSSTTAPRSATATPDGGLSKKGRQALKKQRAKERLQKDEIDRALEELAIKDPSMHEVAARVAAASTSKAAEASELHALLAVSAHHLDPEAELRKFFGAKAVASAKADAASSSSSSSSPRRGRGKGAAGERSVLTRPKGTWWPANMREGLTLRAVAVEELDDGGRLKGRLKGDPGSGEKWWTVEYSKRYKGITRAFVQIVLAGDPEGLYDILRRVPWHADTLLQLSEVYWHREEHSTAVDFIERALFTYERAFVGAFSFSSGANRLDFLRVENRPFFLAVHRQTADLQRRGVFRTAFEWARLLWSLDPWSDPHGALFHLDFLAIKVGMHDWLLDVTRALEGRPDALEGRPDALGKRSTLDLPGWAYARALALRAKGDQDAADEALKEAVKTWPAVVPLLADKADVALSSDARAHGAFRIFVKDMWSNEDETLLHLLAQLYAQRSAPLWKDPMTASWLARTVDGLVRVGAGALPRTQTASPAFARLKARPRAFARVIYRHVVVLQPARLLAFLPAGVGGGLACDPVPPTDATSAYDDDEFWRGAEDPLFALEGGRRARARRQGQGALEDAVMRQLGAMFEAHPALGRMFPRGLEDFERAAMEMDPEALQDLMLAAIQEGGGQGQEGRMPGGMPGEEGLVVVNFGEENEGGERDVGEPQWEVNDGGAEEVRDADGGEDEGDEDEDDYVAPAPVRALRNLIGRFWPMGGGRADESSEDEDDEDEGARAGAARDDDID